MLKKDSFLGKYLSVEGRLDRFEYYKRLMEVCMMSTFFFIALFMTFSFSMEAQKGAAVYDKAWPELSLLMLFPYYCIVTRRLHDIGKGNKLAIALVIGALISYPSRWVLGLSGAISYVGDVAFISTIFVTVYLIFVKGVKKKNKYGLPSKSRYKL